MSYIKVAFVINTNDNNSTITMGKKGAQLA